MDVRFSAAEEAFRAEVRAFIAAQLPGDIHAWMVAGHHPSAEMLRRWTRILHARGWSTPGWPSAFGGPGWSAMQRYVFEYEMQLAPAPAMLPFGVNMVGPVIYTFGTPAQQARFLPGIATLDTWWCQGFSEPGAGSDLASLRTQARREGDGYVVSGQKTWTSYAQHADWIFVLVRTSEEPKRQQGISFLLIDMHSPGITVRPIVTIDGGREVNEVFFDDVRVPGENLVGHEGRGWECAKFLLGHERLSIARVGTSRQRIARIRQLAEQDGVMAADAQFRRKIAAFEIELRALEMTQLRVVSGAMEDAGGAAMSMLKVRGSELQQATTELMLELAGPSALARRDVHEDDAVVDAPIVGPEWSAMAAPTYFNWRKVSIYGGSNEIQKTIIARSMGL